MTDSPLYTIFIDVDVLYVFFDCALHIKTDFRSTGICFRKTSRECPMRPYARKAREGQLGCARGASCAFCQPTRSPSKIPDLSRSLTLRLWDVRRFVACSFYISSHHFTRVLNNWKPPLMACSACIAGLSQSEQGLG